MDLVVAHGSLLHPFEGMAQFGTDWWYVAGPLLLIAAGAAALHRLGADPGRVRDRHVRRIAAGAGRVTGLPDWAGVTVATLLGFLPVLALGFFFDVAWHVDLGRDEYLLSPPHVLLALGVGPGFAGAGLAGVVAATRTRADVGWRWTGFGATWRVPISSAFLLVATAVATVGWGVDELWHMVYGLDVTMWSPTHMGMIGSAFLLGAAVWVLLGEAGGVRGATRSGKALLVVLAGATLEAVSSVQHEYDLGIQQWPLLYQPLLIAMAAGLGLPAARAVLGRGGALAAAGVFVALRLALAVTVDQVWHLSVPRFPLYLGAAIAVEVAFVLTADRRRRLLACGIGIATVGLAGEWAWSALDGTYVGLPHTWQLGLFPGLLWALPVALAATAIGLALGDVALGDVALGDVALRDVALGRPAAAPAAPLGRAGLLLSLATIAVALAVPSARVAPTDVVEVRTAPVSPGLVDVTLVPEVPGAYDRADRLEVFSWQGGADPPQTTGHGRVGTPLLAQPDGSYRTAAPVPVGGSWKTMVLLDDRPAFGAIGVHLPADEAYGLPELPVAASRVGSFAPAPALLMREVRGGTSPWVHILAYLVLAVGLVLEIAVLALGVGRLRHRDRRRPHAQHATAQPQRAQPQRVEPPAVEPVRVGARRGGR
jgi:hypothetical protein